MAILPQNQIKANIESELADNNAGLISAYDVRHNMVDTVDSINQIVASGDFDVTNPFANNVKFEKLIIVQSGISFPNANSGVGGVQYEPYPGPQSILHNSIAGLTVGDPHIQYMSLLGTRVMQGNLGLGTNWINSSGSANIVSSNNRGLQFQTVSPTLENINVGSGTKFVFNADQSAMNSAKGVAKAWINFAVSGGLISVKDSYNIHQIERVYTNGNPSVGKFKIVFSSGTFASNNYVVMANSNARSDNDSGEDFSVNTVGTAFRTGDDASTLRSVTYYVLNDAGQYVDAAINELVAFGTEKGGTVRPLPTIVN
jgi:hypothetical protein